MPYKLDIDWNVLQIGLFINYDVLKDWDSYNLECPIE